MLLAAIRKQGTDSSRTKKQFHPLILPRIDARKSVLCRSNLHIAVRLRGRNSATYKIVLYERGISFKRIACVPEIKKSVNVNSRALVLPWVYTLRGT